VFGVNAALIVAAGVGTASIERHCSISTGLTAWISEICLRTFNTIMTRYRRLDLRLACDIPSVPGCLAFGCKARSRLSVTHSLPVPVPPSPAYHSDLNALRRSHTLPMVASPSTRERNYIRAYMILAKELEGLVRWRIAFMNESVQALLPCCHSLLRSSVLIVCDP
jgi:hypothetical protein